MAMADASDPRRHAPAALRNRDAILDVLRSVLPPSGLIVEVASGTGEHVMHFARALPTLIWQPSDPSAEARRSIAAWTLSETMTNIRTPLDLDAEMALVPIERADAVLCINMIHISPWSATEGLMRGARRILPPGGALCLYGPFKRAGRPLEPSNQAFDADLRERDARWGLRALEDVKECGLSHGLNLEHVQEMPANNLMLILRPLD